MCLSYKRSARLWKGEAWHIFRPPPYEVRRGLSLVELLVAIGVLGLLASLMLSAIQASRESARRVQCHNNLMQLGKAAMGFASAHPGFPETSAGHNSVQHRFQSLSPHVHLLPFIDQQQLYSELNLDEPGADPLTQPPTSTVNSRLLKVIVPLFRCPSDAEDWAGANNYRANLGAGPSALKAVKDGVPNDPVNGSGAFHIWRGIRPAEISDGLSNTAMFSERLIGGLMPLAFIGPRDYFFPSIPISTVADAELACWLPAGANPAHDSYSGTTWLFGSFRHTWYNHVRTPNSPLPDCGAVSGVYTARSAHPEGVNLLLADGAGRFIASAIDLSVWRALATRAGHESLAAGY